MNNKKNNWSLKGGTDANSIRKVMSNISLIVRDRQYQLFEKLLNPKKNDTVLDVGVSLDMSLKDTNFFEEKYPYKKNLAIASVEDCESLVKKWNLRKFIKIEPGKALPIKDKMYDIVVSWATLEHVGTRKEQELFIKELSRVGKKVFITTPDRYSIYEPHSTIFFIHWLPLSVFRKIVKFIGKEFWAEEKNLNTVSFKDVQNMLKKTKLKCMQFKIAKILLSHIVIYGKT